MAQASACVSAYPARSTTTIFKRNLRIPCVISYLSSNPPSAGARKVNSIELVDPQSGQPLRIRDTSGKVFAAGVYIQQAYTRGIVERPVAWTFAKSERMNEL